MIEANLADLVHSMDIEEPSDQSLLSFSNVIPSSPPLNNSVPKDTLHTNLKSACMNVEVVDNTMQNLDLFSPAPKAIQQTP